MAKGIIHESIINYEGIQVRMRINKAKMGGKDRIYVEVIQSGEKRWQNSLVRVSKFQGTLRFESEK